ncbi:hypothetical protein HMPREF9073_02634 [Capnocytophaga sp. oral taxon 326 str. F0382]|nr:hypothetical protein HMPREF9073_02634 [Capnocytophaga sp. oral taxon 326 str. F0382]
MRVVFLWERVGGPRTPEGGLTGKGGVVRVGMGWERWGGSCADGDGGVRWPPTHLLGNCRQPRRGTNRKGRSYAGGDGKG